MGLGTETGVRSYAPKTLSDWLIGSLKPTILKGTTPLDLTTLNLPDNMVVVIDNESNTQVRNITWNPAEHTGKIRILGKSAPLTSSTGSYSIPESSTAIIEFQGANIEILVLENPAIRRYEDLATAVASTMQYSAKSIVLVGGGGGVWIRKTGTVATFSGVEDADWTRADESNHTHELLEKITLNNGMWSSGTSASSTISISFVDVDGNTYPNGTFLVNGTLTPWTGASPNIVFSDEVWNGTKGVSHNKKGALDFTWNPATTSTPNGISAINVSGNTGQGVTSYSIEFEETNYSVTGANTANIPVTPWSVRGVEPQSLRVAWEPNTDYKYGDVVSNPDTTDNGRFYNWFHLGGDANDDTITRTSGATFDAEKTMWQRMAIVTNPEKWIKHDGDLGSAAYPSAFGSNYFLQGAAGNVIFPVPGGGDEHLVSFIRNDSPNDWTINHSGTQTYKVGSTTPEAVTGFTLGSGSTVMVLSAPVAGAISYSILGEGGGELLNENNFASNSTEKGATQASIKAYSDSSDFSNVVYSKNATWAGAIAELTIGKLETKGDFLTYDDANMMIWKLVETITAADLLTQLNQGQTTVIVNKIDLLSAATIPVGNYYVTTDATNIYFDSQIIGESIEMGSHSFTYNVGTAIQGGSSNAAYNTANYSFTIDKKGKYRFDVHLLQDMTITNENSSTSPSGGYLRIGTTAGASDIVEINLGFDGHSYYGGDRNDYDAQSSGMSDWLDLDAGTYYYYHRTADPHNSGGSRQVSNIRGLLSWFGKSEGQEFVKKDDVVPAESVYGSYTFNADGVAGFSWTNQIIDGVTGNITNNSTAGHVLENGIYRIIYSAQKQTNSGTAGIIYQLNGTNRHTGLFTGPNSGASMVDIVDARTSPQTIRFYRAAASGQGNTNAQLIIEKINKNATLPETIEVDITGIADGDAIVWDATNTKFVKGASSTGGSLTTMYEFTSKSTNSLDTKTFTGSDAIKTQGYSPVGYQVFILSGNNYLSASEVSIANTNFITNTSLTGALGTGNCGLNFYAIGSQTRSKTIRVAVHWQKNLSVVSIA